MFCFGQLFQAARFTMSHYRRTSIVGAIIYVAITTQEPCTCVATGLVAVSEYATLIKTAFLNNSRGKFPS